MAGQWSLSEMPSQAGRVALVTGANRGLGLEISAALAAAGATVVMACRNPVSAQSALDEISRRVPGATLEPMALDLADLASVRRFAQEFCGRFDSLGLLVNNASAIMVPKQKTRDGFEMHIGTNHLGHFALTGLLLGRLAATGSSRIVNTASLAHRLTPGLDLDDLNLDKVEYKEMDAYGRSKLAALLFTFELDRRLRRAGLPIQATVAHPGYTATNTDIGNFLMRLATRIFAQAPAQGALPALYAATAAAVQGGDYIGPGGMKELRGPPVKVSCRPEALDETAGARLWSISEQLTGVSYLSG